MGNLSRALARDRAPSLPMALLSSFSLIYFSPPRHQLSSVRSPCRCTISLAPFSHSQRLFFVNELTISRSHTFNVRDMLSRNARSRIESDDWTTSLWEEQQLWLTFHADIRSFYRHVEWYICIYIDIYIYTHTCFIYFWIGCWSKSAT